MNRLSNLIAIARGLITTDQRLPTASRTWQVVSRLTWELPTTVIGLLTSAYSVIRYNAVVQQHQGATFIKVPHTPEPHRYWAFTLGTYIVGSQNSTPLLPHEYGHYLQSRALGPLYLPAIAIPSLLSAALDHKNHSKRWFEKDADKRSASYHA